MLPYSAVKAQNIQDRIIDRALFVLAGAPDASVGLDAVASVVAIEAAVDAFGASVVADRAATHGVQNLLLDFLKQRDVCLNLQRVLQPHWLRTQHAHARQDSMRDRVSEILADVPVLLLKGAALRPLVYAHPCHRPSSDLDIWVPPMRVAECCQRLIDAGFVQAGPDAPEAHHHAAPLMWGDAVVEVHRSFLGGGRSDRWEMVFPRAVGLDTAPNAYRPCTTDLLWQAWHHNFRSALHWLPWKLIGVADIVRLLHREDLDWTVVRHWVGLTRLRQIVPIAPEVLARFNRMMPELDGVDYRPITVAADRRAVWQWHWPSAWWLAMRHGILGESLAVCWERHLEDLSAQRRHGDCEPAAIYSESIWHC